MITKRKWEIGRSDEPNIIIVGGKNRDYICNIRVKQTGGGAVARAMESIREANARLIAAACNACQEINPDNPQAAAEALVDLYKACKCGLEVLEDLGTDPTGYATDGIRKQLRQAISKAEGKEQ